MVWLRGPRTGPGIVEYKGKAQLSASLRGVLTFQSGRRGNLVAIGKSAARWEGSVKRGSPDSSLHCVMLWMTWRGSGCCTLRRPNVYISTRFFASLRCALKDVTGEWLLHAGKVLCRQVHQILRYVAPDSYRDRSPARRNDSEGGE